MANNSGIVQNIQQGQGTQESTYFTHQFEGDAEEKKMVGSMAETTAKHVDSYVDDYLKDERNKKKDYSPLMTGAGELVSFLNNSPHEVDESEKQDRINQYYETFGHSYSISEMTNAINAQGGEELLKASFSSYRANAAKAEEEQKALMNLGWQVNPNAEDAQAAVAAGYTYMSNKKYIEDGAKAFQQAETDTDKAMSLQQISPALITTANKDIQIEIDKLGGVHNVTTYQLDQLKSKVRSYYTSRKLPGEFVDYIVNRTFYTYDKIAKANDKDKSAAITQQENAQKALKYPAVISLLQQTIPVYGERDAKGNLKKTGEISGATYQATIDLIGKENVGYLTTLLGGDKFVKGLVDKAVNTSQRTNTDLTKASDTALSMSAAYLLQAQPKTMNDVLYNNEEGSSLKAPGEEIGSQADDKILDAISKSLGKGNRMTSTAVNYLNKNRTSKVTPSMIREKRSKMDTIMDIIAKEYKEVFNGDSAIPLIDTESGLIRLFKYDEASSIPGLAHTSRTGKEVTTSASEEGQGLIKGLTRFFSPNSTASLKFYGEGNEKEKLKAALDELARETDYPVKDIYKQYNSAVSRTLGLFPSQIERAVRETPTEEQNILASNKNFDTLVNTANSKILGNVLKGYISQIGPEVFMQSVQDTLSKGSNKMSKLFKFNIEDNEALKGIVSKVGPQAFMEAVKDNIDLKRIDDPNHLNVSLEDNEALREFVDKLGPNGFMKILKEADENLEYRRKYGVPKDTFESSLKALSEKPIDSRNTSSRDWLAPTDAGEETATKTVYADSEVFMPLDDFKVTEKFVKRDVVLTGKNGDPVYAPVNATVAYSGKAPGQLKGDVVIMIADANPTVTWTYSLKDGTLNSKNFKKGDHVTPGDVIAFTGKSGSVRVMLKDGDKHLNPMEVIDAGEYKKKVPPVQTLPPDREEEEAFDPSMLRAKEFNPSMLRKNTSTTGDTLNSNGLKISPVSGKAEGETQVSSMEESHLSDEELSINKKIEREAETDDEAIMMMTHDLPIAKEYLKDYTKLLKKDLPKEEFYEAVNNLRYKYNNSEEVANWIKYSGGIAPDVRDIESLAEFYLDLERMDYNGNIDVTRLPRIMNKDGTFSTVESITIEEDGEYILIPTIIDETRVSDKKAIKHYHEYGKYLGKYDTKEEADIAAKKISSVIGKHDHF